MKKLGNKKYRHGLLKQSESNKLTKWTGKRSKLADMGSYIYIRFLALSFDSAPAMRPLLNLRGRQVTERKFVNAQLETALESARKAVGGKHAILIVDDGNGNHFLNVSAEIGITADDYTEFTMDGLVRALAQYSHTDDPALLGIVAMTIGQKYAEFVKADDPTTKYSHQKFLEIAERELKS